MQHSNPAFVVPPALPSRLSGISTVALSESSKPLCNNRFKSSEDSSQSSKVQRGSIFSTTLKSEFLGDTNVRTLSKKPEQPPKFYVVAQEDNDPPEFGENLIGLGSFQTWFTRFKDRVLSVVFDEEPEEKDELRDVLPEAGRKDCTVLVVGATGTVGKIVMRKLVLRGYRVRALVRNLYYNTLDTLGTQVEPVLGDIRNMDSLRPAMDGCDKIICCVGTNNPDEFDAVFNEGVANILKAYQDAKKKRQTPMKRTLISFSKPGEVESWTRVTNPLLDGPIGFSQASQEFVSRGQLIIRPAVNAGRDMRVFTGFVYGSPVVMISGPMNTDLTGFGGLLLRANGDGKKYSLTLRTTKSIAAGVQYECEFLSQPYKWSTLKLPFDKFVAVDQEGQPVPDMELAKDLTEIRHVGITSYGRTSKEKGQFYLEVDYIKVYKEARESDVIMLSCATVNALQPVPVVGAVVPPPAPRNGVPAKTPVPVAAAAVSATTEAEASSSETMVDSLMWIGNYRVQKRDKFRAARLKGERVVRNAGVSYTIVRPALLTNEPGGQRTLMVDQRGVVGDKNRISAADVADILINAMHSPQAVNVTFEACEVGAPGGESTVQGPLGTASPGDYDSLFSPLETNT